MKILIASPIDKDAMRSLSTYCEIKQVSDPKNERLDDLIKDCNILIFRSGVSITAELMAKAPNLELLIRAGSGIDNLDTDYVRRRGLTLVRIPEPGAKAVAEMSFALMLALSRNVVQADRLLRRGRWAKNELTGYQLSGKVLGIIGTGNIGSYVGRMGAKFGMKVIGCRKNCNLPLSADLRFIRLAGFNEVIASADYISLHVPLTDSTRKMIGSKELSHMKPGAFLINLARGGVVDEDALFIELTQGGRLRGAALDVHEREGDGEISPLAELPNVILTPHIGAMTFDSQREIGRRIVDNVFSYMETSKAIEPMIANSISI